MCYEFLLWSESPENADRKRSCIACCVHVYVCIAKICGLLSRNAKISHDAKHLLRVGLTRQSFLIADDFLKNPMRKKCLHNHLCRRLMFVCADCHRNTASS